MPNETITVTCLSGPNSGSYPKTFSVFVDPVTGKAPFPLSIPLSGANAGTDVLQASMAKPTGGTLFSAIATVTWHNAPTIFAVNPVIEIPMPILQGDAGAHPRPYDGSDVSLHPGNIVSVYYNDVHDRPGPDTSLTVGGYVYLSGGSLPSQYQGIQKITALGADKPYHDTEDTYNWFQFICGGPAKGLFAEYGSAQYQRATIDSANVSPAPASAGTGSLQLTPAGGIAGWTYPPVGDTQNWRLKGSSYSLTLNIGQATPVVYPTYPYIPLFEGVQGKIYIYNDIPSPGQFTFQGTDPQSVDKTAAAPAVFQIIGNNSSWNGRVSIAYNDSTVTPNSDAKFSLLYNGSPFDSHVDTTTLQIQDDDIAWFNSTTKTFDLFTPTVSGGGGIFQIEVDYMVKPIVASVSPLSVPADGASHVFTINLSKPFSPRQQGVNGTGNVVNTPVVTFPGGHGWLTVPAILDGNGWLTGWTVSIIVPASSSNSTVALGFTLTGTLTYLQNDAFVTGSVTYIPTATAATITLVGSGYTAPIITAFSVVPKSGSAPSYTVPASTSETFTVTASNTTNNAMAIVIYCQQHGTSNRVVLASFSPSGGGGSISHYTSGGLFYTVFTISIPDNGWYPVNDLGAQVTDQVSSLQSNLFFDSSTYTLADSGGGGGGGGCPALEMFVNDSKQVDECQSGDPLTCLASEPELYLDGCKDVESQKIIWTDRTLENCYHIITENGAEIIVSKSTPVATRETLVALREGHPVLELPTLAADIRAGLHVLTDVGNGVEWSRIVETSWVGHRMVMRLFCGGRNFAAGMKPGKYIFTHNALPGTVK